jgi:branched-chain amino acid transport system substrate-binding protein
MSWKPYFLAFFLVICLLFSGFGLVDVRTAIAQDRQTIPIGGLFSLTGKMQSYGKTSQAAMDIAIEDLNAMTRAKQLPYRFEAVIADTRLDPREALLEGEKLLEKGVKFIVGPPTSAELKAMSAFANSHDVILISPSSTFTPASGENDHIFRFCLSESVQGLAISTLMKKQGIEAVIPVWRDDPGNDGIQQAMRKSFTLLGGRVFEGMKYSSDTQDFLPIVHALTDQVKKLKAGYRQGTTAVFLSGFDEAIAILASAKDNPVLSAVKWYGSDGMALNDDLIRNPRAAAFAEKTSYPCPTYGLDNQLRKVWSVLNERIKMRSGLEVDAYTLAVYDAVWVAAKTHLNLAASSPSINAFRKEFIQVANTYTGATGKTALYPAGSRKYGNYDFWVVRKKGAAYEWQRKCNFNTDSGVIFYY